MIELDVMQPWPLTVTETSVIIAMAAMLALVTVPAFARFTRRTVAAMLALLGVRRYIGERATVYQFSRFRLMVNRRKARKPRTATSVRELARLEPLPRYVRGKGFVMHTD